MITVMAVTERLPQEVIGKSRPPLHRVQRPSSNLRLPPMRRFELVVVLVVVLVLTEMSFFRWRNLRLSLPEDHKTYMVELSKNNKSDANHSIQFTHLEMKQLSVIADGDISQFNKTQHEQPPAPNVTDGGLVIDKEPNTMPLQVHETVLEQGSKNPQDDAPGPAVEQQVDVAPHQHRKPQSAIFYNIYISPSDPDNGIRIITEQTEQMLKLMTSQKIPELIPLYYNMVGVNYTKPFCPSNLTCTFLKFYENAFEEVTLQSLHDYCSAYPQDVVYYLHNKGSLSISDFNEGWRRSHTDFVLSGDSISRLENAHNGSCTISGMVWDPLPWWHIPGNFWAAKCSYVRKLLPPKKLHDARVRMIERLVHPENMKPESPYYCLASFFDKNVTNVFNYSSLFRIVMGLDRYSNEHWVSSHPDVMPCDNGNLAFTTSMRDLGTTHTKNMFANMDQGHEYEWYRMHGRLFEMNHLYQSIPPNSSFFWKYYEGTEVPTLPKRCQQGEGRNLSFYLLF